MCIIEDCALNTWFGPQGFEGRSGACGIFEGEFCACLEADNIANADELFYLGVFTFYCFYEQEGQ